MNTNQGKKFSLEREIREEISKGTSQKKLYDTLKNEDTDQNLAGKITDYLPQKIKNKTRYINYFIIILLIVNVCININILVIVLSVFLFFYLKEGNAYGYRNLPLFALLNIIYVFYVDKTPYVYIKMSLWLFLGILGILFHKYVFKNKTVTGKTKQDKQGNYIFLD